MEQDRAGQQLGNYRLIRSLGSGGFATVYLGEHMALKTKAAIKVMRAIVLTDKDRDHFLQEANMIRRLSHRNIIRVLECGVEVVANNNGTPYIVMSVAEKGNIRNLYPAGKPLPLDVIVTYINQAADGLQCAHDMGMVHCDIKPENMLIGLLDELKLGDFGIADISHTHMVDIAILEQENPFYNSMILGTVSYMAPERFRGQIRRASDQYSLGIVAYEWLTGELPFVGKKEHVMHQHLYNMPSSLYTKRPDISREVEQVVMKALAKDPDQRYSSVKEFARELKRAIDALHQPAVSVAPLPIEVERLPTQPPPVKQPPRIQEPPPLLPVPSPPPEAVNEQPVPQPPAVEKEIVPLPPVPIPQPLPPVEVPATVFDATPPLQAKLVVTPPSPSSVPAIDVHELEPIVLQSPPAQEEPQKSMIGGQPSQPSRSDWYQRNVGQHFSQDPNDPHMSVTESVRPPREFRHEGGFNDFSELFTAPVQAAQHWFDTEPDFARLPEYRNFRTLGMALNALSPIVMGLLLRSWGVFLACLLAPFAFALCIRLVKPLLAGTIGILLAFYWGFVGWALTTQLIHIPLFATLPAPEFMGVIFFLISAYLHINYIARRVP